MIKEDIGVVMVGFNSGIGVVGDKRGHWGGNGGF